MTTHKLLAFNTHISVTYIQACSFLLLYVGVTLFSVMWLQTEKGHFYNNFFVFHNKINLKKMKILSKNLKVIKS